MGKQSRKPSSELLLRVSNNLRALPKARGYTQRQLATLCGVTISYVSNVEQATCNVTLATLELFSRALDCSEVDLLLRRPRGQQEAAGYSSEKSSFCG